MIASIPAACLIIARVSVVAIIGIVCYMFGKWD